MRARTLETGITGHNIIIFVIIDCEETHCINYIQLVFVVNTNRQHLITNVAFFIEFLLNCYFLISEFHRDKQNHKINEQITTNRVNNFSTAIFIRFSDISLV